MSAQTFELIGWACFGLGAAMLALSIRVALTFRRREPTPVDSLRESTTVDSRRGATFGQLLRLD